MNAACGGSITMKTAREANLMFEELAKNNYQPPSERGDGRNKGEFMKLIECRLWKQNLKL